MSFVNFYSVRPIPGLGMPLLITVGGDKEEEKLRGEMYLLLQDEKCTLMHVLIDFSEKGWPKDEIPLDDKFVESELKMQAKWRINNYFFEKGFFEKFLHWPMTISFEEADRNALISLWMHSPSKDSIKAIAGKTHSKELSDFIDLVMGLPEFKVHKPE